MRANLSMPRCAIIPVLEYPDVPTAVTWLEEAFGFEVRLRIGAHRAQLQFGGARSWSRRAIHPTLRPEADIR